MVRLWRSVVVRGGGRVVMKRLFAALRRWLCPPREAAASGQPMFDELVESILRDWYARQRSDQIQPRWSYEDFRSLRLADARRDAVWILGLPPLDRIVLRWLEGRGGR